MQAFHNKPAIRKLARAIIWVIPACTLPFLVFAIAASGFLWPLTVLTYSAFVIVLGYCDTHLPESATAPICHASPGRRLQIAMGFYGIQIFVAPLALILIGGFLYLGINLVTEIRGL